MSATCHAGRGFRCVTSPHDTHLMPHGTTQERRRFESFSYFDIDFSCRHRRAPGMRRHRERVGSSFAGTRRIINASARDPITDTSARQAVLDHRRLNRIKRDRSFAGRLVDRQSRRRRRTAAIAKSCQCKHADFLAVRDAGSSNTFRCSGTDSPGRESCRSQVCAAACNTKCSKHAPESQYLPQHVRPLEQAIDTPSCRLIL